MTQVAETITQAGVENSSAKVFPEETLLLAMYGATIGRLGILKTKAATNQACAALLPVGTTKSLLPFLFKFLLSERDNLKAVGQGGAQPNISQAVIKAYEVAVPPLNEQRRIVDKVDALFAHSKKAKASLDRIPALLEKLKKSILAAAFRGDLTKDWREAHPDVEPADKLLERIRTERRHLWEEAELTKMRAKGQEPKDDRWKQKYKVPARIEDPDSLASLPRGWSWASFEEVTENHDGRRVPVKREDRASRKGEYPYYGASGVIDQVDDYLFDGDFLLVAEDGANLVARSTPIAFLASGKFWVNNHAHVVQTLGGVPLEFVEHQMESKDLRHVVTGTAQPKLTQKALARLPIALAPWPEQVAIVQMLGASLSKLTALRAALRSQRSRQEILNRAILAKAFRGELVSQDPNDEPASVLLERIRAEREAAAPAKKARGAGRGRKKKTAPEPIPPAEPERSTPTSPSTLPPAQSSLRFEEQFLDLGPREQAQAVATALFGAGPLPKADALGLAADGLREMGLSDHKRLRTGGKLHTALEKALTNGVRYELFDRPARGEVRAIKPDPNTWTETDWALVAAAVPPTDDLDTWVQEAATWAADNCGLQFTRLRPGGHIDRGLRAAAEARVG